MLTVTQLRINGYEQVVVGKDPVSGLHALIAIHSTRRGPALGGIRMWPYANEAEALEDVLRLAAAMTNKAAISELPVGGGKAVIIGDPEKDKSRSLLLSMGELIESLQGRYIGAKDSGILPEDLDVVSQGTRHLTGTTVKQGGSGDPSIATAQGVVLGMKAACQVVFGNAGLNGRVVAIQGIGHVGWNVGRLLAKEGASLLVADLYPDRVERAKRAWKASVVPWFDIHRAPADIFAPCALGGVLNPETISQLHCAIVAGGANNQFLDEERGPFLLMERGILHVPDYVLNAGGLIHLVVREILRQRQVAPWLAKISDTVHDVVTAALREHLPPLMVANRLALQKLG